jgi:hypothetical protein
MTPPKHAARQREDLRKGILKKLANGAIKQSELERMFPNAGTEIVRSVITHMLGLGEVHIDDVNGRNVVSLPPPAGMSPRKEVKIEPILPKVEPIMPMIEPLERPSGVYARDSPERLILSTLTEGARMRETLIRLIAGQTGRDDANKLLDRMIKSGIINETRSGRISLVEKHGQG